ncbi:MAG TPA: GNAT family N-acetyltransferase [Ktedonobacterales bacterium]|nr:GNAT family N-acetyltransferase [Ktedonobacterales bacterium]
MDRAQALDAVEANWCAAWLTLGAIEAPPRSLVEDTSEWVRIVTPEGPEPLLNNILRFRPAGPVTAQAVERAIAPYRKYHLPFQWWLTPNGNPPGLAGELRRLGMYPWGNAKAMAMPLDGWQPPAKVHLHRQARVRQAPLDDEEGRWRALDVICTVFGVPRGPMGRWCSINPCFRIYLAELDDQPAAAMALLQHGEVAGLYHVATLPAYRRQGIAARMIVQGLQEAQEQGARLAVLTATPEGEHLYKMLGYEACGAIEQWMPSPSLLSKLYYG